MRILTLNCGSATLKFHVFESGGNDGNLESVAGGQVDRIGDDPVAELVADRERIKRSVSAPGYPEAFDVALDLLLEAGLLDGIEAAGHRIVHGGDRFDRATLIDDAVVEAVAGASGLAPLHNERALRVIEASRERLSVPMVAAFDTAFFASMPALATTYALPRKVREEYGVRRFGFHGLAHRYMTEQYRSKKRHARRQRLITLQLGGGCSATASLDGVPIDTSMGFTPLEGLIMGTRSGNIDPAIPLYILRETGFSPDEVENLLNHESGLLGLSGRSDDIRELLRAEADGNTDAAFAVDAFCRSIKKYIASYMALLGGAEAIVFGGGIGENSPEVRARVFEGMEWAGIQLEPRWNRHAPPGEVIISDDESRVEVWVMRVDEARVIAREVLSVLADSTA